MRRSSVDQKQDRRTDTMNGDAHHLTGGDDCCREATAVATATTTTEKKGGVTRRACTAGQPKDRPPPERTTIPAGASGATKPSAGEGAEVKIVEGKGAGRGRACPAGQPEEGPPPGRTAVPAGTSGAATATSARAGAVAKKKPEAVKVVSRRGYTGRAVIPAQKKEIVSVAKAMHQENFATKVKELFDPEREATLQALKTGVYVGWRCPDFTWDCIRVGESCHCFCGHLLVDHHSYTGQSVHVPCAKPGCGCRAFAFIPSRPEEVGEFWLRKRPGFEPESWRAKCRCKHSHDAHHPRGSLSCKTKGCSCPGFESSFLCAACDRRWEQHETFFDTEKSRREAGLPVGEAYLPFAEIPKLRNAVLTGSEEDDTEYKALREGGLAALPPGQPAEDGVASDTKASGFRPVYD
ncbi:protein FAM221B [Petromyzon marinus]|uniref:Protein FAM221B n=1 Tax=Petromyzon marinus TaxID=7757 RepID=A0AAJ7WT87_PETMA|nr:protein FAM221B [Petromyzon marinus]